MKNMSMETNVASYIVGSLNMGRFGGSYDVSGTGCRGAGRGGNKKQRKKPLSINFTKL